MNTEPPSGFVELTGHVWREVTTGNMIIKERKTGEEVKERMLVVSEAKELMEPTGDCLQNKYDQLAKDILALHKPDIVKDFSRVQATSHALGESNVKFINENLILKKKLEESEFMVERLRESVARMLKQRDDAMNAGGFCIKHKPTGGVRNCLICACMKLTHTLEKIDYELSEPNEMGVSDYCLHYDEEEVLRKVKELVNKKQK